jgi:membrane protease YdiL (CAAX protease family)
MSTATAPVPEQAQFRLVAPLWHTGLVLLYVLVPRLWWFKHTFVWKLLPTTSSGIEIVFITLYGGAAAFVCLGVSLQGRPVEDLIGRGWSGWQSALRDVGIGIGFWLVVRYADRLIYYLTPIYTPGRTIPHSTRALVIGILFAISAGIAEELVFRGYLQQQFAALCRNWGAGLVFQAILFALFHGYTQPLATYVQHFCFGLLAGIVAHWRKSLLPGMIGHAWLDGYWDVLRILKLA